MKDGSPDQVRRVSGEIDALTFTSSSTVKNFVECIGKDAVKAIAGKITVAAIGPITADTARELGLPPHIVAEEHTIPGLVNALVEHFR